MSMDFLMLNKSPMNIEEIDRKIDELTNCPHEKVELRYITNSHEKKMYVHQCLFCGRKAGDWIKHSKVRGAGVPFNEELINCLSVLNHDREDLRKSVFKDNTQARREIYDQYMGSIDWLNIRDKALSRDEYLCQGCLEARATQVHHLIYDNLGQEFLFELISLCAACHTRIHE